MSSVKRPCSAEAAWPSGPPMSCPAFQGSLQGGPWELSPLPMALLLFARLLQSSQQAHRIQCLVAECLAQCFTKYRCSQYMWPGLVFAQMQDVGSQRVGQMVQLPCRKKVIGQSQGAEWWSCSLAGDLAPDFGLLCEDAHGAFQKPEWCDEPTISQWDGYGKQEKEHLIVNPGTNHGGIDFRGVGKVLSP